MKTRCISPAPRTTKHENRPTKNTLEWGTSIGLKINSTRFDGVAFRIHCEWPIIFWTRNFQDVEHWLPLQMRTKPKHSRHEQRKYLHTTNERRIFVVCGFTQATRMPPQRHILGSRIRYYLHCVLAVSAIAIEMRKKINQTATGRRLSNQIKFWNKWTSLNRLARDEAELFRNLN